MNQKQLQQDLDDAKKLAKHFEESAAWWKAKAIELEQRVAELTDMLELP